MVELHPPQLLIRERFAALGDVEHPLREQRVHVRLLHPVDHVLLRLFELGAGGALVGAGATQPRTHLATLEERLLDGYRGGVGVLAAERRSREQIRQAARQIVGVFVLEIPDPVAQRGVRVGSERVQSGAATPATEDRREGALVGHRAADLGQRPGERFGHLPSRLLDRGTRQLDFLAVLERATDSLLHGETDRLRSGGLGGKAERRNGAKKKERRTHDSPKGTHAATPPRECGCRRRRS